MPSTVLVLGGSVFVGRAVVHEARAAGAAVTVVNRGVSGPVPAGVEHVRADRTVPGSLEPLRGRSFDLVVDTCGYVPVDVARSAELLAPTVGHYAFVSTVNAFPGWPDEPDYRTGGVHRGEPDATRDDVPGDLDAGAAYGWLKVGCELAVQRAFGDGRCSVLRGGAIVGPWDSRVGRLPWWIDRVARGGDVLVPGRPDDPVALVDARDLARFALLARPGVFETAGPSGRDTRGDLIATCLRVTGGPARPVWVDDEAWLVEQGVAPWTELPLWAPRADAPSLFAHHVDEAAAAGMTWRPLADTVADTWAWMQTLDEWRPGGSTPGLAPQRESQLLAAWAERAAAPR